MPDVGAVEPAAAREGPGGSARVAAPPGRQLRRRLPGGLAGRRYLLAIGVLVALATIPTLAVTQAGFLALRQPAQAVTDTAPFITGNTDPAIVVASPSFVVGDPTQAGAPPPVVERPREIGACHRQRADGFCVVRATEPEGVEVELPAPYEPRPLGGRHVIA